MSRALFEDDSWPTRKECQQLVDDEILYADVLRIMSPGQRTAKHISMILIGMAMKRAETGTTFRERRMYTMFVFEVLLRYPEVASMPRNISLINRSIARSIEIPMLNIYTAELRMLSATEIANARKNVVEKVIRNFPLPGSLINHISALSCAVPDIHNMLKEKYPIKSS